MTGHETAERVPLNWKRPPEWDRFMDRVAAENDGYTSPYAGIAIERAWAEYREEHDAEAYATRLLTALGRRETDRREKNTRTPTSTSTLSRERDDAGGGGRATVRVRSEVKDEMAGFAAEVDAAKHEVLRAVVCWYVDGGLLGLLTEKLRTAVTDAERQQAGREDPVPAEKPAAIAAALGESFTLQEFTDAAADVGVTTRKYAIQEYLPDVLERTDAVPHPATPEVFLSAGDDLALANPNPADLPYYAQTDADRRVGVQVAGVRKAWGHGGKAKLTVREAVDALAGEGSPRQQTARAAMQAADDGEGFRYDSGDGDADAAVLAVDTAGVTTDRVLDIAGEERARERGTDTDTGTEEPASTPGVEPSEPPSRADVDAELARLTGEAATDGGTEP